MEPITRFSVETHSGPYERWPARTALFDQGRATGCTVPGYVIEGQYQCEHGSLLIMSHDCPFAESYAFLLLDDALSQRARVNIEAPPLLLHAHWPIGDGSLRLHFHTRSIWTLTVRRRTSWWQRPYGLHLKHDGEATGDARAQASIAALERDLEAIRVHLEGESAADR